MESDEKTVRALPKKEGGRGKHERGKKLQRKPILENTEGTGKEFQQGVYFRKTENKGRSGGKGGKGKNLRKVRRATRGGGKGRRPQTKTHRLMEKIIRAEVALLRINGKLRGVRTDLL